MTCATDPVETRTALIPHQRPAVAKMLPTRVGALFMDMGTGKTRVTIELIRLRWSKIDRVVWFCPVSLKATIRREILKHTDAAEADICVFDDRITQRTLPDAWWYIVGIESMSSSARVICAAFGLVTRDSFVVVDESTYIKGHRAKRTERITRLAEDCRYRLILTGTPFTQGAVDLYSQMRFLSPKILGYSSWYSFARHHIQWSERYRGKIERTLNTEWLAAKIKPYVYQVTKDECLSLPKKLYKEFRCSMTHEQDEAYLQAKEDFATEVMEWEHEHPNAKMMSSIPIFRLFSRLQSIACGWDGLGQDAVKLDHKRLDLLMHVLRSLPDERVVIWAKYRKCTEEIVDALRAEFGHGSVAEYHGDVRDRESELTRWREGGRFLVARQSVGAYGLDLTASRYAVFYAHGFKYAERIQAEDRQHRFGQDRSVTYVDLWAECKIEARVQDAIHSKGDALARFRREVEAVKGSRKDKIMKMVEAL